METILLRYISSSLLTLPLLLASCSGETDGGNAREIGELNRQLEAQSRKMEQTQTELESLRDSITGLQTRLERIRSHAIHARVDVEQARTWAKSNGYGNTLVPSIDNVLYDLDAIKGYSSGAAESE